MTIDLINWLFNHSLHRTIPKPALKPASYDNWIDDWILFTYIITNWYISNKFFGIMINTGVLIYSITEFGQFLVYQKYNSNTSINTNNKKAINIQFDISSILSIRSTIINTLIGSIKFYTVQSNTLFLFYWADLDCLNIYYNDIINSLVIKSFTISVICHFNYLWLL